MPPDSPLHSLGALEAPLRAVGLLLEASGRVERLVVVGGIAILLRGVRIRPTTDVDVMARAELDGSGYLRLVPAEPLSEELKAVVSRVARDFGLEEDWINTVIAAQWRTGPEDLPPGLEEELTWFITGGLHVGVAGRRALLALKLYAAVDTGPTSVHTQDLLALAPTEDELAEAAPWVRAQDPTPAFHTLLDQVLAHVRPQQ